MWLVTSVLDSAYLYEEMHEYIHCSSEYDLKNSTLIKDLNIKGKTLKHLIENMSWDVQKDFLKT